ncbi:MAG: hypothetical protein ACLTCP_09950 [Ruminococcus bicirculans (ex Wegman et al. 2014)]
MFILPPSVKEIDRRLRSVELSLTMLLLTVSQAAVRSAKPGYDM